MGHTSLIVFEMSEIGVYGKVYAFLAASMALNYLINRQSGNSSLLRSLSKRDLKQFTELKWTYISVYLIMASSDWLQGSLVYKLYDQYGFSEGDIGLVFIAGYGSSLVFGTLAGPITDRYGRRLGCIMYGVFYGVACMTKHYDIFSVLLIGRLLSGVATSLLQTSFEAWVVSEHENRKLPKELLANIFSASSMLNGFVAILTGIVSQWAVDTTGSYVTPFDIALAMCLLGIVLTIVTWRENYGNSHSAMSTSLGDALLLIFNDKAILAVGLASSLFDSALYIFVFVWTPVLTSGKGELAIPLGLVFSLFMVSCMTGGTIFRWLHERFQTQIFMAWVCLLATASFYASIHFNDKTTSLVMFCFFEACCGIYWPSMSFIRSKYLPQESRSTIMNIFRIPTNLFVVVVLGNVGAMSQTTIEFFCMAFLLCSGLAQLYLSVHGPRSTEIFA